MLFSVNLYTSVLLMFVAFCFAYSKVIHASYAVATDTRITESRTKIWSQIVRSMVECSIVCASDTECCTASYNKQTKNCQMDSNCCAEYEKEGGIVAMHKRPTKENSVKDKPRDCSYVPDNSPSGVYTIYPDLMNGFDVYCEDGWTIFQRRINGKLNFYQPWSRYKGGFGNVRSDYWLGNDKLHVLSSNNKTCGKTLKIVVTSFDDRTAFAVYNTFHVKDELSKYKLFARGYSGSAGDAIKNQNGRPFSTLDQDNDNWSKSCAKNRRAGFWFNKCAGACLNGPIIKGLHSWRTMYWWTFRNKDCLKTSLMMLK